MSSVSHTIVRLSLCIMYFCVPSLYVCFLSLTYYSFLHDFVANSYVRFFCRLFFHFCYKISFLCAAELFCDGLQLLYSFIICYNYFRHTEKVTHLSDMFYADLKDNFIAFHISKNNNNNIVLLIS